MATLWITEFPAVESSGPPVARYPSIRTQSVTIPGSGSATIPTPFGTSSYIGRILADVNCAIDVGASPTFAGGLGTPICANIPEYIAITPGHTLAVQIR